MGPSPEFEEVTAHRLPFKSSVMPSDTHRPISCFSKAKAMRRRVGARRAIHSKRFLTLDQSKVIAVGCLLTCAASLRKQGGIYSFTTSLLGSDWFIHSITPLAAT